MFMVAVEEVGGEESNSLSRKDQVLLGSVLQWYNEDESRVRTFSDIVTHKNGLSLRIIDWLITNFSKTVSVAIESDGLPRSLRRDYDKNLSAHNKKNFDPFARRRKIRIVLFGKDHRMSTIGQLNFFRWFITKNLTGFLLENKSVIEKHMKRGEASHQTRAASKRSLGIGLAEEDANKHKAVKVQQAWSVESRVYSGSFRMSF